MENSGHFMVSRYVDVNTGRPTSRQGCPGQDCGWQQSWARKRRARMRRPDLQEPGRGTGEWEGARPHTGRARRGGQGLQSLQVKGRSSRSG